MRCDRNGGGRVTHGEDLGKWAADIRKALRMANQLHAMRTDAAAMGAYGYFAGDLESAERTLRQGIAYQRRLLAEHKKGTTK